VAAPLASKLNTPVGLALRVAEKVAEGLHPATFGGVADAMGWEVDDPRASTLAAFLKLFQQEKRDRHLIDFGDMLAEVATAIQSYPDNGAIQALTSMYRHVMVDECQDSSIPLASLITDFYDKLKTVTSGYASMNYEFKNYEATEVVKLDIIVGDETVESLATLVWKDHAYAVGKKITESLKDSLPRQQFELKIQAAISGKVIAAERLSALRKDVLAKMSGGDYTRKMKLLQKQKKGKKRMLSHGKGKVDIPTEAYLAVLKR
jgi:translation elongation factor EF-4